jgi:hypothetical protein
VCAKKHAAATPRKVIETPCTAVHRPHPIKGRRADVRSPFRCGALVSMGMPRRLRAEVDVSGRRLKRSGPVHLRIPNRKGMPRTYCGPRSLCCISAGQRGDSCPLHRWCALPWRHRRTPAAGLTTVHWPGPGVEDLLKAGAGRQAPAVRMQHRPPRGTWATSAPPPRRTSYRGPALLLISPSPACGCVAAGSALRAHS